MELEKSNKELLEELNKREEYWTNTIQNLSKKLNCSAKDVVQLQSDVLSQRQRLEDEIKYITYELHQFKPIIKNIRKIKTEFYLTKYPLKLQGKDKLYLIEHDLSLYEQRLDFYDTHIEFLRNSSGIMEQIGYGIKNKITLYQLTDLD
jgi:hypothetical protein